MEALEIMSALLNGGYALGLANGKRWAWPLGFLGTIAGVVVLFHAKLYAESVLNIGYAVLAVYGWVQWGKAWNPYTPSRSRLRDIGSAWLVVIITSLVMKYLTNNPRPISDAFMFGGGILGTWWQAQRERANWLVWIMLNSCGIWLYASLGLFAYAGYSAVMAAVSVWGWFRWGDPSKTDQANA